MTDLGWFVRSDSEKSFVINYDAFIDEIEKKSPFVVFNEAFVLYKNRVWTFKDARTILVQTINKIYEREQPTAPNSSRTMKVNHFKELIGRMEIIHNITEEQMNPEGMINCRNGIYNLKTNEFLPDILEKENVYERGYYFFYCFDIDFDPKAKCPQWIDWISRVLPRRADQVTLMEFLGYMLFKDNSLQKFLLMYGQGGNGKGTVMRVLISICGGLGQISTTTLEDLDKSSFARLTLVGKILSLQNEPGKKLLAQTGILKMMTGQDPMRGEIKHGASFDFVNSAKVVIVSNELPIFRDLSEGFTRRILAIEFSQKFTADEMIENYDLVLLHEKAGIFNEMITYYQLLKMNHHFTPNKRLENIWIIDNNSIMQWWETYIIKVTKEESILMKDLFKAYLAWAEDIGLRAVGYLKFARELRKQYYNLESNFNISSSGLSIVTIKPRHTTK